MNKKSITEQINYFKHNGISFLETLNEKQLSDIIHTANIKYHNDTPIITDNQYDIIKEFIEKKYPSNQTICEIGANVNKDKVKLPYEMHSMNKIKPDTNALNIWTKRFTGPYIISCKLDGVSGLYSTTGSVPKLYTRGNGYIGQDVSHLIPFLRLPQTKGIVIRGEFIISKYIFETKYQSTFSNPRNMVAGVIKNKQSNAVSDIRFVTYEVIVPELTPKEQMNYLHSINADSVLFVETNYLTNEMLSDILVKWRNTYTYMYNIDGIIVTDNKIYSRISGNPIHSFAFKMVLSDQIIEAKVVDVIWNPSKDGYLKPRVQIEPVKLGGVTIEYATGFNALFIKDNNIGVGTVIELIRSGDVIPHIKKVIVPSEEPKMPQVLYKWNDTGVDVLLENINDDKMVKEKNITMFFKGIGIDGLRTGNINKLINAGYDNVPDIIQKIETDYLNENSKSITNKFHAQIKQRLDEVSIVDLMTASNIFGRGFSYKKIEAIMSELPTLLISNDTHENKIKSIGSIKGISIKTGEAFVSKIEEFKKFIINCNLEYKLYEELSLTQNQNQSQTHELSYKNVVLTGSRNKQILAFLQKIGANICSNVSKNTFIVISKTTDNTTTKTNDAYKLEVPIISEIEFIDKYLLS